MNIDTILQRLAVVDEGRPLLLDLSGRSVSGMQFASRVRKMAGGLRAAGFRQGTKVGLLALNSVEYCEAIVATICAGMTCVPLNLRWSAQELLYGVQDAGIEVLIVDDNFLPVAGELLEMAGEIRRVYHFGSDPTPMFASAYEGLFTDETPFETGRDPATHCLLLYTGGTTGFPKGVVHSHASILASAVNMATAAMPAKGRGYLISGPLFHVAGFSYLFTRLMQNETLAILPKFTPELAIEAVRKLDIEEMSLVPTMLHMLLSHPDFDPADFAKIRRLYYGSSPISQGLLRRALEVLPHMEFVQAYGMTEVGVVAWMAPQFHSGPLARPSATGQAMAWSTIRIEDDNGTELPRGEMGEVVIYGPSVMSHYHNKPEETAAAIRNGGMRSGDAGIMDEMGVLFLLDRVKDMIVTGGENVYSSEVENAISTHAEVAQVAVIGIPDDRFGEAVHAVIVPKPGCKPELDAIRDHAALSIARYKCPRSIELVHELPLSAMNKVLKGELRKAWWQGRERGI